MEIMKRRALVGAQVLDYDNAKGLKRLLRRMLGKQQFKFAERDRSSCRIAEVNHHRLVLVVVANSEADSLVISYRCYRVLQLQVGSIKKKTS